MSRKRRLAFIVPRFEPVSAGGAEVLAREVAHRLQAKDNAVTVLTTCARNHFTWQNYYDAGHYSLNGLNVHRFRVKDGRNVDRFLRLQQLIDRNMDLSPEEERQWISESVTSPDLQNYLEMNSSNYDVLLFIPYLFGVTWFGTQVVPEKSVLVPCLHDEPFARLGIFKDMFQQVRGIMFNSSPEQELAERLMKISSEKGCVVGMGFEPQSGYDDNAFREKFGIEEPFILYAGRREAGKNVHLLIEYFSCYKRHNPGPLKLVLLGTGEVDLPSDSEDIIDMGYLDEQDKRNAHAAALLFCQPSVNESFSIVLMDSWMGNTPVLVNAKCDVTKHHCIRSRGGLYFRDFFEFEEIINVMLNDNDMNKRMAGSGRAYVEKEYSWDAVVNRFENALEVFGF